MTSLYLDRRFSASFDYQIEKFKSGDIVQQLFLSEDDPYLSVILHIFYGLVYFFHSVTVLPENCTKLVRHLYFSQTLITYFLAICSSWSSLSGFFSTSDLCIFKWNHVVWHVHIVGNLFLSKFYFHPWQLWLFWYLVRSPGKARLLSPAEAMLCDRESVELGPALHFWRQRYLQEETTRSV